MTAISYKIDKDVPRPACGSGVRHFPFNEMEVGDSFAIPFAEAQRVRTAATNYGIKHGIKFSVLKVDSETSRCWRVA